MTARMVLKLILTAKQCRMACGGLGWNAVELSKRSGVRHPTVTRFMKGDTESSVGTLTKIEAAIMETGLVEFVSPNCVCVKDAPEPLKEEGAEQMPWFGGDLHLNSQLIEGKEDKFLIVSIEGLKGEADCFLNKSEAEEVIAHLQKVFDIPVTTEDTLSSLVDGKYQHGDEQL